MAGVGIMKNIIKFEIGMLIGTIIGAVMATLICSMVYNVMGYDAKDLVLVQDCLLKELSREK